MIVLLAKMVLALLKVLLTMGVLWSCVHLRNIDNNNIHVQIYVVVWALCEWN